MIHFIWNQTKSFKILMKSFEWTIVMQYMIDICHSYANLEIFIFFKYSTSEQCVIFLFFSNFFYFHQIMAYSYNAFLLFELLNRSIFYGKKLVLKTYFLICYKLVLKSKTGPNLLKFSWNIWIRPRCHMSLLSNLEFFDILLNYSTSEQCFIFPFSLSVSYFYQIITSPCKILWHLSFSTFYNKNLV